MNKPVILRYAPSLSGKLHIGNTKVMMINHMFYKNNPNSEFVLRYDDSDNKNNWIESMQNISLTTHLLNINFTKIIFQSSHSEYVNKYVQLLKDNNLAYYCGCKDFKNCICYSSNYKSGVLVINTNLILKNNEHIEINDLFYGKIRFNKSDMYNIAILRSNGSPLYNFITVVSDIVDNINLIIRGNDHIANTWKQIVIYKALNVNIPKFAHIPLVLNNKNKMSKSSNNGVDIIELIKNGYTVDAIKEYILVLSGIDINCKFNRNFAIDTKSNQNFDIKKLDDINSKVINSKNIYGMFILFCTINNFKTPDIDNLDNVLEILKYRHKNLRKIYNEVILFETNRKHNYNWESDVLSDSDFEFLKNIRYPYQIYELSDSKVRFIITGNKLGVSIKEIKKIIDIKTISNRIDYLLSFRIS